MIAKLSRKLYLPLLALSALLVIYANYMAFIGTPNEVVMGPVQRIFYFHVAAAIACYVSSGLLLVAAFAYLAGKRGSWDNLARAAAECGLLFCSINLSSGMIWGHAAWNTWFRWEPRLVSSLLLWLIFLGLYFLRKYGDPQKVAAQSAVLGVMSAVMVPVVVYSIQWLPKIAQLHPRVVENRGLRDPSFGTALFVAMLALVALQFFLLALRIRIAELETLSDSEA